MTIEKTEPTDRLSLGAFLPYRLSVLAESVSRAFAVQYERRFGLTIPEWRVMAVLGERAPQATQDVIERTRMDRVRVSRATIRLVDKGLIARQRLPGDQRAYTLALTEAGAAMYRQILPIARDLQHRLVAPLDAEERAVFEAVMTKLLDHADTLALLGEG